MYDPEDDHESTDDKFPGVGGEGGRKVRCLGIGELALSARIIEVTPPRRGRRVRASRPALPGVAERDAAIATPRTHKGVGPLSGMPNCITRRESPLSVVLRAPYSSPTLEISFAPQPTAGSTNHC